MIYTDGLTGLRRLLDKLRTPDLRLTRDGKDIKHEEIAKLELEIERLELELAPPAARTETTPLVV